MSNFCDNHSHFTGSLPVEFVWREMRKKKLKLDNYESVWNSIFGDLLYKNCVSVKGDLETKLFEKFKEKIETAFRSSFTKNINTFFNLYSLFQYWTKTQDEVGMQELYINGTEGIAKKFDEENVENFEIIAGPLTEWRKTKLRFDNMILGLKRAEIQSSRKKIGKLRLTFISNGDTYKNYSNELLNKIFNEINSNVEWKSRVSGFDFSGVERIENLAFQEKIIKLINEFNRRTDNKLTISVHAGEDLCNNNAADLMNYFSRLLNLEVDRVCHGTFLWIPNKYLHLSKADDQERIRLLDMLPAKGIELELCPTANLLLSPLVSYNEIPIRMLSRMGINYSINTDNKTIFSTKLSQEYKNLNLPL